MNVFHKSLRHLSHSLSSCKYENTTVCPIQASDTGIPHAFIRYLDLNGC